MSVYPPLVGSEVALPCGSIGIVKTPSFEWPDQAAGRWQAFFENTSVGVIITDQDGRFLAANSAYQRMLGYSDVELCGLSYMELTVEEDRSANRLLADELAAGRRRSLQIEKRYRRKNGEVIWVNVSGNVIPGAPAGSLYFAAIVQDITERKRAQIAFEEAQAELAHVTRVTMLGELAASIAHEINQPLGAIIADASACLNWLAAEPPDILNVREALHAIVKDGERAANVLTRIRALLARTEVMHEDCDLTAVVRDVLLLVNPELVRRAVSIGTSLASDLPQVLADQTQIQQVLLNLLLNAVEASKDQPPARRRLLVSTRIEPQDGERSVVVAVRDYGVGLPANLPGQLFEPFFTTKPGGLGMGLSISRSIIESHAGRLWATSNADHGATFHFSLPLAR
jgi:PAS domain S-box-containing protein